MMPNRKKGYVASATMLKNITANLQRQIKEKKINSIPKEIRDFMKDAEQLQENQEKHFSPEKAVKLRGSFLSFYAVHDLIKTDDAQSMLSGLHSIKTLSGSASSYFSDAYEKVYTILKDYKYREFCDSRVYFVDKVARDMLVGIGKRIESKISTTFEKRNIRLNKIVNLLNKDDFATQYSVKFIPKYQYISKPESIKKYLPQQYKIERNKIIKEYNELFATHDFDDTTKKILLKKRDSKIESMDAEYKYIMEDIESDGSNLDVKIVSYDNTTLYPEISMKLSGKGKENIPTVKMHLRSEVVNVLWYVPKQLKDTNTVANILKNYSHAFGSVYYKEI